MRICLRPTGFGGRVMIVLTDKDVPCKIALMAVRE